MNRWRLRLASWLLGDREALIETMWTHVKTNGFSARERASHALDAILGEGESEQNLPWIDPGVQDPGPGWPDWLLAFIVVAMFVAALVNLVVVAL